MRIPTIILSKFRTEIEIASNDEEDIVSAYEEVIEKFDKEYPKYKGLFQEKFNSDSINILME